MENGAQHVLWCELYHSCNYRCIFSDDDVDASVDTDLNGKINGHYWDSVLIQQWKCIVFLCDLHTSMSDPEA
jgi:hypothetical protein